MSGLRARTLHRTCRSTFSAVLPVTNPETPMRPTVPITIRSIRRCRAKSGIACFGSPLKRWTLSVIRFLHTAPANRAFVVRLLRPPSMYFLSDFSGIRELSTVAP